MYVYIQRVQNRNENREKQKLTVARYIEYIMFPADEILVPKT